MVTLNALVWAIRFGTTAYVGKPIPRMISVYTSSTPLPRVNGPRRRRLTSGSIAVASRMASISRNNTSWTRHRR